MSPRDPDALERTRARCLAPDNQDAAANLKLAIANAGLSTAQYARIVLKRPYKTCWRWVNLLSPIPKEVREFVALTPKTEERPKSEL